MTTLIWTFAAHTNGHRPMTVWKTTNNEAVAAATRVAAQRWPHRLNELTDTVIDPYLAQPETRATTRDVIGSLLAPLTTKNCWSLAQQAGHRGDS